MKTSLLITLLIICLIPVFSQKKTDANIVGHIISNGTHVPFVTISVKGTTIGVNSDETGHYRMINLPVGKLTLRAECVGYKPSEKEVATKEGVTLEINFELDEDILGIEEVVVTADRSEIKRKESVSIVNTLPPKFFLSSQSVTLLAGLTFSPGIRIENNCQNCGFSQVRINGLEGPYSQILINSRPVFSSLAGVYGLELIPANMIERVEVVRGGGSALYGSNAIAGIINIILNEPLTSHYEAGFTCELTGLGLKSSGGVSPDFSVNLNTSVVSSDSKSGLSLMGFVRDRNMFDANGDGFSEISQLKNQTINTHIFHKFGLRNKLNVDFFNIKEDRSGGNRFDLPLHERDISETVKHDIKTGTVNFEKYFREYDLLSIYLAAQHVSRDSYYGANRSLKGYGTTKGLTFNSGIQYKALLGNSSLIAGIERTEDYLKDIKLGYPDFDNAIIVSDSIIDIPHALNIKVSDQVSTINSLFMQYDLKTVKFKMGLGARFDHYKINDRAKDNDLKTGKVFSPRISLMYQFHRSLQVRISYSQGFRAPQIFDEDLHIETSGARQVIHENVPDLKQETSNSFMASLDFNHIAGNLITEILIEGFFTRLNNPFINEIGLPDENGKVIYTRKNAINGAEVKGVNIEFKAKFTGNISLITGITAQSSRYDKMQQFNTRNFFRTPSNYGYFNLDLNIVPGLKFSSTGTYTGKMLIPYFGPLTDPEYGELRRSDPFFDFGTKISYNVKLNGLTVQFFTGVKNIFNSYQHDFDTGTGRDPSYIYGPVLPRTVYFGIRFGNRIE
ncbi:MAG: TonB-dependent receptor [Bacteroidales bacterium]